MSSLMKDYTLLDSGAGKKLEKFGNTTLIRPCSQAIWKKNKLKIWQKADWEFIPKNGWYAHNKTEENWTIDVQDNFKINVRLQKNGQVGIFPEHMSYLHLADDLIRKLKIKGTKPKVLNLFAYTGLASLYFRTKGCEVVHVDISKKCLEWAKENFELNNFSDIKIFENDAIDFLFKEEKRRNFYDIIICDPPNFSRVTKSKNWELDRVLKKIIWKLSSVANKKNALIIFTEHLHQSSASTISNLFRDEIQHSCNIEYSPLVVKEMSSPREVYFGNYTKIEWQEKQQ